MGDGVDLRLWGKARGLAEPYPLVWHMVDAAAMAGVLWERFLTEAQRRYVADQLGVSVDQAGRLVGLWAALHDIGKAVWSFQAQEERAYVLRGDPGFPPPAVSDRLAHAVASQFSVGPLLAAVGYSTDGMPVETPLCRVAQILGGHHGRFAKARPRAQLDPLRELPELGGHGWQAQRGELFRAMYGLLGEPAAPARVPSPVAELVTGLIIVADWLVSQVVFIQARQAQLTTTPDLRAQFALANRASAEALGKVGLGAPSVTGGSSFDAVHGFSPNALQRSVLEELPGHVLGPGLLVVTAATGDGKTEAGLSAAEILGAAARASGLFFALPTMATSDQMYGRIVRYLGQRSDAETPLTLLHSMSWLNREYEARTRAGFGHAGQVISSDDEDAAGSSVLVSEWLRGAKRGLLARFSVGTIDQALLAALPVKHNVLRLLGLSGKVFIVDEAHAYDAYMQALLRRLLTWLGAMRCPVILLSATLPSTVSSTLVQAYLDGSLGKKRRRSGGFQVPYPGWLYVDGATGTTVTVSTGAARAIAAQRRYPLELDVRPVRHSAPSLDEADHVTPPDTGTRLAVLREILEPVVAGEGCAAVVCNTVADAQATYLSLKAWATSERAHCDLSLLHARLPADERERRTSRLTSRYGKQKADGDGPTVRSGIVVATQVIEQSLDLDFDLVVSDIAPVAMLLQRAGRCFRHAGTARPSWASGARLVVLDAVRPDRSTVAPPHWGDVYSQYLLRVTHDLLAGHDGTAIQIPDDVQELVEKVYATPGTDTESDFINDAALAELGIAHQGQEMAEAGVASMIRIPAPPVLDLSELSDKRVDELAASTRLGADTVRLVCCYADATGDLWLNPEHSRRLPGDADNSRVGQDDVRAILGASIPVNASWHRDHGEENKPPPSWGENAWLRDVFLLPHRAGPDGRQIAHVGGRRLYLDPVLGLVRPR